MTRRTRPPLEACATIRSVAPSAHCATRLMEWVQALGEKPGSWIRNVLHDEAIGLKVDLRRPEPGLRQGSHGHRESFEQLYVVGGDFEDHRYSLRQGDFVYRRPGVPHGSVTRLGAEVLVIFNETDRLDTRGHDASTQHEVHARAMTDASVPDAATFWQPVTGSEGVVQRELYDDPNCGMRASIVQFRGSASTFRIAGGAEFTHVFVVSGTVIDETYTMVAGDYACYAPGVRQDLTTVQGAELLAMNFANKPR